MLWPGLKHVILVTLYALLLRAVANHQTNLIRCDLFAGVFDFNMQRIHTLNWRVPSSPPESRLIPCEAQVG